MFNTPRTIVKTRGAHKREQDELKKHIAHQPEVQSEKLEVKEDPQFQKDLPQRPRSEGSLKKKSLSSSSSIAARKKELELQAAQAKARIEMELIDKKLAADIAALEEQSRRSDKSRRTAVTSCNNKVEEWLERSHTEVNRQSEVDDRIYNDGRHKNNEKPAYVEKLADALKQALSATTVKNQNQELLTRLSTSKDLPPFYGDPMEWLQFKEAYYESTQLCNYSDTENIWRLRKCLRGEAKEAVSSLLIGITNPAVIIDTLQLRFGRPEIIMCKIVSQLKKLQPLPQSYHNDIVNFSIKIKNYVATTSAMEQSDYLRSPELTALVVSKFPTALITKWADYAYEHRDSLKCKLELIADFLHDEAIKAASAGISHIHTQDSYKKRPEERKPQVHTVQVDAEDKCRFCKKAKHQLVECTRFKRALKRDRWRFARAHKLCYKCLTSQHGKQNCLAPDCDIEGCGQPHHNLLHWSKPEVQREPVMNPSTSSETVNMIHTLRDKVLLKVVPVTIHGPKSSVSTYALLDDGASISLISSHISEQIGLHGKSVNMRVRSAWDSSVLTCESEIVNIVLSNSDGERFNLSARKINELNLKVQSCSKINYDKYKHYSDFSEYCVDYLKPTLLVGQDNYHLIAPICCIPPKNGKKSEPYLTKTPLGWCVHGSVRASNDDVTAAKIDRLPVASECDSCYLCLSDVHSVAPASLPSLACECKHREDSTLHDEVRRYFTLESIGVNAVKRENSEDKQALSIVSQTAKYVYGKWEVGLPWHDVSTKMTNSFSNALKRFKLVGEKMLANKEYASEIDSKQVFESVSFASASSRAPASACFDNEMNRLQDASYNDLQLHVFCDASIKAMCAVAYWRWRINNKVYVAFIAGKCRVAPVKVLTVPRLELQAALLAARLADTIMKEHRLTAARRCFWSDSTTVLHWIRNDARNYKPFVAYRLGEIDELTRMDEWRYVPTKFNVADIATRDNCDHTVFESEWFYGPSFLHAEECSWPENSLIPETENNDNLEYINTNIISVHNESLPVPDPIRFSSWIRLLRTTARVLLFIKKCQRKRKKSRRGPRKRRRTGTHRRRSHPYGAASAQLLVWHYSHQKNAVLSDQRHEEACRRYKKFMSNKSATYLVILPGQHRDSEAAGDRRGRIIYLPKGDECRDTGVEDVDDGPRSPHAASTNT